MEVPQRMSILGGFLRMRAKSSSRYDRTPTSYAPRAPPPERIIATLRGPNDDGSGCCEEGTAAEGAFWVFGGGGSLIGRGAARGARRLRHAPWRFVAFPCRRARRRSRALRG